MSRKAARERRDHQRGGDHDTAGGEPLRRCLVTGVSLPKDKLVRFVAAPDDTVVPDVGNELPGRGAWVSANAKAIAKAVSKGQLAKALDPKADAALHGIIGALLAGSASLKDKPDDAAPVATLRAALADYPKFFDDPTWQPLVE